MTFLLQLLQAYKGTLITLGLIAAIILGLWLWHVSEVSKAEQAMKTERDRYWTELIENSPVKIETTLVKISVPRKDTSGTAAGIAKIDSAYKTRIDSLLMTVSNKDSMLRALSVPYEGTIKDTSFGKMAITYYPLNLPLYKFSWSLTERPPKDSTIAIIQKEKMVPIPFRVLALSADVNPVGQVYGGLSYRFDNVVVGTSYQALGPAVGPKWYDRLRLGVSYYVH